ncbi:MAG: SUF system NifU family Fe-S cluster assembly protein [Thermotogaceae bacterium]|nr:SUF system NifU family Fe-S cluster assembly protein [Thermotogaceae bacterium]HDG62592.1 SUF system NifU family Fe-S cluster assembly protein [Thermotoga sp.]
MNLYSEIIMDYAKLKKYKKKMNDADTVKEGANLSCGDEIKLYVKVRDGKIESLSFEGKGCIVSQASANLMIERVLGESLENIHEILENVEKMVKGEEYDKNLLKNVSIMENIRSYPNRVKCFMLAWRTLENALKELNMD